MPKNLFPNFNLPLLEIYHIPIKIIKNGKKKAPKPTKENKIFFSTFPKMPKELAMKMLKFKSTPKVMKSIPLISPFKFKWLSFFEFLLAMLSPPNNLTIKFKTIG